ncbi:alpha/beta fold hydrolase [Marinobacteraceae bacterium S3BR75-40.1]
MTAYHWVEDELEIGDLTLTSGEILHSARVAYHRIGQLNAPKDNLVLLPTYYGGARAGNHPWVGGESPLDPARYCILIPAMLGAGESSSPSNTPGAAGGPGFPRISLADNVNAQARLLDRLFPGAALALVMGWSMGGMQALQWGTLFPQRVRRLMAVCSTARCSVHNAVFLEGVKAALTCDPAFASGHYRTPPERGLRAFGRVYAGWAYGHGFFRNGDYRQLGFDTIEALLQFWENDHLAQDANDLLTVLDTWQQGDISTGTDHAGDLPAALARLTMPATLMPSRSDLYFTVEDARTDAALIPGAHFQVIESDWGHVGGGPGRQPQSTTQIFQALRRLLEQPGGCPK